jgi:hypothetical protein
MMNRSPGFVFVALLVHTLSGCGYGSDSVSCPSWAGFPTTEEKYDAADLVVVASSSTRDGTSPIFGVDAHAYEVRVGEVLKGDVNGGSVRISSMPDPCSGTAEYPDGDPLDTSMPLLVFATQQGGEWFTLTPLDGTVPFTQEAVDTIA